MTPAVMPTSTTGVRLRPRSDLLPPLLDAAEGTLSTDPAQLMWSENAALTVVLAARGYPGSYAKGGAIGGLENVETAKANSSISSSSHHAPEQLDVSCSSLPLKACCRPAASTGLQTRQTDQTSSQRCAAAAPQAHRRMAPNASSGGVMAGHSSTVSQALHC